MIYLSHLSQEKRGYRMTFHLLGDVGKGGSICENFK